MGLLITQRKDEGWRVEIREQWLVDTFKGALKVMDRLMIIGIEFKITYSFELVHIHIEDAAVDRKEFDKFQEVMEELMKFKNKYGHGVI